MAGSGLLCLAKLGPVVDPKGTSYFIYNPGRIMIKVGGSSAKEGGVWNRLNEIFLIVYNLHPLTKCTASFPKPVFVSNSLKIPSLQYIM